MTVRGNFLFSKQKVFEDEFNEISMIKDSTNMDTLQLNEESFNLDLLKHMGSNQINLQSNSKRK